MRALLSAVCLLVFLVSCADRPSYSRVEFTGNRLVLPVQSFTEAAPAFYTVVIDGKQIAFFVLLLDGTIQSYFDACMECYSRKMGYRHEKGHMVCKACNERLTLERLDSGIGGCYPIKLQGTRENDRYVIEKEALSAGTGYF